MTDRLLRFQPPLETFIKRPFAETTIISNLFHYNKYILCVKKKTTQYIVKCQIPKTVPRRFNETRKYKLKKWQNCCI